MMHRMRGYHQGAAFRGDLGGEIVWFADKPGVGLHVLRTAGGGAVFHTVRKVDRLKVRVSKKFVTLHREEVDSLREILQEMI
jgi:hypothetical protein